MNRKGVLVAVVAFFCLVCLYLFYKLMAPFFVPIAWSTVLAVMFHPVFAWTDRKLHRPNLSSVLVCILVLLLVLLPIGYLGGALVSEAYDVIKTAGDPAQYEQLLQYEPQWFTDLKEGLKPYVDVSQLSLGGIGREVIAKVGSLVVGGSAWLATNITKAIFYFLIILFSLFYFLRDGSEWVGHLRRLIPMPLEQVDGALKKIREIIEVTMYGGVAIAFIQGFLGGTLFAIFGIDDSIFWGGVMGFMSLIPFVGGFIVYIPAGIIMILSGSVTKGILLIVLSTVIVSQADNVLRPFILSGKTQMHPLLLFFTIMGGVTAFGLLGIVIGPLVAAFFVALVNLFEVKVVLGEHEKAS